MGSELEALVRSYWLNKARGLLLGQACGDAIAVPFAGAVVVSNQRFADHAESAQALCTTSATRGVTALGEHVATAGPDADVERDAITGAWLHAQWKAGKKEVAAQDVAADRAGVTTSLNPAVAAGVLALGSPSVSRVAAQARDVAGALAFEGAERSAAAVQACAVALALAGGPGRRLDRKGVLSRLREISGPELAERLDLVRQLLRDATPAAAASALGTGDGGAVETLPVALLAFLRFPDDPVACVRFTVKVGGDTISSSAMAGALLGARLGETHLPQQWIERLDCADELREVARRIVAACKQTAVAGR